MRVTNRHFALAGVATLALILSVAAQTESDPTSAREQRSQRPIPFHGMISAVDQTAKTFTITGKEKSRVFKITAQTKITKAGRPATMIDITENQEVSGAAWQKPDGTLEAKLVKLGPAEKARPTPAPKP